MYKNIIFDYGQVIISFDPYYMTSVYTENEEDRKLLCQVVFDRMYWDKLDNGSISDSEVKAAIKDRIPKRLYETADKIYDNWYYNNPLIEDTAALIKKLKENGAKLYLLSNISVGFAENYTKIPVVNEVLAQFDGLVFSGPIGMNKPNRDIFEYLLNKFSLKAEECVFIDDSKKNLDGAAAVGINTIHFTGDHKKLEEELNK
ncbi:MAG: HAD family phosphatase [Clostridia bacterium]|nr:HAD family phosphatase [Clostridia bacterium]